MSSPKHNERKLSMGERYADAISPPATPQPRKAPPRGEPAKAAHTPESQLQQLHDSSTDDFTIDACADALAELERVKAERDELLAALKEWEVARKNGGISHADLYEAAWQATQAAIAKAEGRAS